VIKQLDWVPRDHARRRDPGTSHAAARSMRSDASALMEQIHADLKLRGPSTQSELAARLALRPDQVWRRVSDLKNRERIADTGITRPGDSGRHQTVWSAI